MAKLEYRACWEPGCSARASYGVEGMTESVSCKSHARRGMVYLDRLECAHEGCSVLRSPPSPGATDRAFCPAHARPPIPPVESNRCSHKGCSRQASYYASSPNDESAAAKVSYCFQHTPTAVPVTWITGNDGALNPSLGLEASHRVNGGSSLSEQRQRCVDHASSRTFFSLSTKTCTHPGCKKRPSYGMKGSKRPEACAGHAREGMVNVVSKRCTFDGCEKISTFGVKGSAKREFCSQHAKHGMVTVGRKMCAHENCFKFPTYGRKGSTKREFCAPHAPFGMVDFTRKCAVPSCYTVAKIRATGGRRMRKYCPNHASEGKLEKERSNKCGQAGCRKSATFSVDGGKTLQFCGEHSGREVRDDTEGFKNSVDSLTEPHISHDLLTADNKSSDGSGSRRSSCRDVPARAPDASSPAERARADTTVSPAKDSTSDGLDDKAAASPAPPVCSPPQAERGARVVLGRYRYAATTDSWPTAALLQTTCGWSKWNWRSARASAIRSINESADRP